MTGSVDGSGLEVGAAGWRRLRAVLADDRLLHAPGCADALTGRLVEAAGFEVAYLSGAAVSAVHLGQPDLGFVGAAEILQVASTIRAGTDLPLVADADTGYGNAVHAARTVTRYRDAGVAALHLEDQTAPKRCGHMRGKQVVPVVEAVQRVRAAVEASAGTIVVIARTDARSVDGLSAAIDRAGRFADVGADLVFVEGVHDRSELGVVHAALPEVPLVLNRSEAAGPLDAPPSDEVLAALGVRLVIHPVAALLAMAATAARTYADIAGHRVARTDQLAWDELNRRLGLPDVEAAQRRYA